MRQIEVVILDGGGIIWYSMDVLWEHYKIGFSYLGICRLNEFPFDLKVCNELSSFRHFNSRKNIAEGLLALYFAEQDPETILTSENAENRLVELVATVRRQHTEFEKLSSELGTFLINALYNYPGKKYTLCSNVKESLNELKNKQYTIVMLSNRYKPSVIEILESHGIDTVFDWIEAPETKAEPLKKPLEKVIERFEVQRSKCVFVADSASDIQSGKEAGLVCVGVLSGIGNERSFRRALPAYQPDYVVDDLSQVVRLFVNVNPK